MMVFEREVKIIHKEMIKHSVWACISAIPGLILAVFTFGQTSPLPMLIVSFVFFVPAIVLLVDVVKFSNVHKQYAGIQNTNKTYDVRLKSSKVKFLLVSQRRQSFSRCLSGIVLIDENQNRYYYLLPETVLLDRKNLILAQNKMKEKFNREICVQCYKNTNIIRSVDKNIHFLRFHHGKLCN